MLEYAASVWDPHEKKHVEKLEKVQHRAARFASNNYHRTTSVKTLLNTLEWTSLEDRRKTARLAMLFKIKHDLVACTDLKRQMIPASDRARRGHDQQYVPLTTTTKYRRQSFLPRTISDWNALPQDTTEATTLDTFLSRVSAQ